MKIVEKEFKGVFEITLSPNKDERGFFMRTYDDKIFNEAGLKFNWVQENHSRTLKKGTIRGLHFQLPPFTETKLVRCIKGKTLDVFVDLRKNSSTFGQWHSIEISEDKFNMVLLPKGFAHGFCTLTDECHLYYKHDNYYNPESYSGILWNDMDLQINWPCKDVFISEKDKSLMTFKMFKETFGGI